jgi:plastocyanin
MMKNYTKILAVLFILFCSGYSKATVFVINVEDFEFSPSTLTVSPGDEVMWMWDNSAGFHTTTSTVIPDGAVSWDEQINSGSQMFSYFPTVPGVYHYECAFHSSMGMIGQFTVTNTTGISDASVAPVLSLGKLIFKDGELKINYSVGHNANIKLNIFDILGKSASSLYSGIKNAGTYSEKYDLNVLPKGIYFIRLETDGAVITRKILI